MRRITMAVVLGVSAIGAVCLTPGDAEALGRRRRGGNECCGTSYGGGNGGYVSGGCGCGASGYGYTNSAGMGSYGGGMMYGGGMAPGASYGPGGAQSPGYAPLPTGPGGTNPGVAPGSNLIPGTRDARPGDPGSRRDSSPNGTTPDRTNPRSGGSDSDPSGAGSDPAEAGIEVSR